LEEILPRQNTLDDFEVVHEFSGLGVRTMVLNARRLDNEAGTPEMILLAIEDMTERLQLDQSIRRSEERFRALTAASAQIVWTADAGGQIEEDSPSWRAFTGQTLEEWRGWGWLDAIHPDDRASAKKAWKQSVARGSICETAYRLRRADGVYRWTAVRAVPVADGDGSIREWIGTNTDITERRKTEALDAAQKEAFELTIKGTPIDEVLNVLVRTAQEQSSDGGRAAIFIVDADGASLRFGATTGMPESYLRAVDHFKIGPESPSCGTAAYTGQNVIVGDVAQDPLWAPYLDLAREHGIRACWSFPISSFGGRVLGTFALYHRSPREPTPDDLESVALFARAAAILIERHKAETALRESEDRYRTLFNSIDEGFCVIEVLFDSDRRPIDYRFLEVNPAFEKQSGLREATGRRMLEFVPDIEDHWLANYGRVALTGEPIRFANEYHSLGRWFDVYAFRLGGPDSRNVAVLFTNITESRQAGETRARLAAIIDSSADAIIGKTLEGVVTSWNAGAERLFEYEAGEMIGRSITILIPPERLDEETMVLESLRRGERIEHFETVRMTKSGRLVEVSLSISPVRDETGAIIGASKIARDITAQRQTAQELERLRDEAVAASRA
ncbi:MAG: PAS domain S-box protein, partial [Opitutaceae bacterium]